MARPELGATLTDDDLELGLRLIRDIRRVPLSGLDHALHGRLDQTPSLLAAIEPFLRRVG